MQVQRTQSQHKPEIFVHNQRVMVQNNISKLWNIKARVISHRSHQGILTNSYVVRAQATGRHLVRSERNIRPAIGSKNSATGPDLDPDQDAYAASVLCNSPVLCNPVSILKRTLCEGAGLSNMTQHASGAASTTGGLALKVSALDTSLQAPTQPSTHPGTPSRERRVRTSPIISIIDTWGLESFEKEII